MEAKRGRLNPSPFFIRPKYSKNPAMTKNLERYTVPTTTSTAVDPGAYDSEHLFATGDKKRADRELVAALKNTDKYDIAASEEKNKAWIA